MHSILDIRFKRIVAQVGSLSKTTHLEHIDPLSKTDIHANKLIWLLGRDYSRIWIFFFLVNKSSLFMQISVSLSYQNWELSLVHLQRAFSTAQHTSINEIICCTWPDIILERYRCDVCGCNSVLYDPETLFTITSSLAWIGYFCSSGDAQTVPCSPSRCTTSTCC